MEMPWVLEKLDDRLLLQTWGGDVGLGFRVGVRVRVKLGFRVEGGWEGRSKACNSAHTHDLDVCWASEMDGKQTLLALCL